MPQHRSSRRRRSSSSHGEGEGEYRDSPVFNRISSSTSARTRRIIVFLVGVWLGGLLMVGLMAPSAFKAADEMLWRKTDAVTQVLKVADQTALRRLMRDEAGEVNRRMFDIWGWTQFALASVVLGLLVFRSNARKPALGMAGGALVLSGLMNFLIIPLIAGNVTRERFEMLHAGFVVFQLAVVLLLCVLLYMLFERRRSGEKVGEPDPYLSVPPPPAAPEG